MQTVPVKTRKSRKSVTSVADYVGAQLAHLPPGMTQKDVANAIGYDKPNIMVMIKRGDTKLPLTKIPALAKVLGIDPLHLLRMALNEYLPEVHDAVVTVTGEFVSENERKLLRLWRHATLETDPQILIDEDIRDLNALAARISKIERETLKYAHDDQRKKTDGVTIRKLDGEQTH